MYRLQQPLQAEVIKHHRVVRAVVAGLFHIESDGAVGELAERGVGRRVGDDGRNTVVLGTVVASFRFRSTLSRIAEWCAHSG